MSNALDDLIAAVEANDWQDMALAYALKGVNPTHVRHAYKGSLDAAKALHEAALPGWEWELHQSASILWRDSDTENAILQFNDTPARAWLLAILRAMKEQASD
ncbi:hypothetical protein ACGYLO_16375 [Sulfitobacter sp. 1A13353]|uniref:hypothetical protein n=1 Tax=Sulfitobacter sp. 1A13353 TaxID=3368568 RepID=UPI003744BC8B